jgi:hypothetical protein
MKSLYNTLPAASKLIAAIALTLTPLCRAQTPNITGEWWYLLSNVPYEVSFEGDKLVNGDAFSIHTEKISYENGRFQNLVVTDENGPYQITPELEVKHIRSEEIQSAYLNKSHDIMIMAEGWNDPEEPIRALNFTIRPPTSFTIAELAGIWDTAQLEVPIELTAPFLSADSPLAGTERFVTERLIGITIDSNGIVTVPDEGVYGVVIHEQGLPVLFADGQKDGFFLNASKDVMIRHKPDTASDTGLPIFLTTILVKRAQGLKVEDVIGQWHYAEFSVPKWMTVQGAAGNRTVDGNEEFQSFTGQVTFCPNGEALVKSDEGEAVFPWKLNAAGLVEVTTDYGSSNFSVNQSKSFMAGLSAQRTSNNFTGVITMVKYSDDYPCAVPTPVMALEKVAGQWQIVWSGGKLQSAPALPGPWTDVTGAASPMALNTSGAAQYYRVKSP